MKFYIVDAFAEHIFGGNPAGVIMIESGEYPSFDIMLKTAAELGFSETAFVKDLGGDKYELRYVTPTDEVDLCGHATIASFSIIGNAKGIKDGDINTYTAVTKAGEINIQVSKDLVMMDMATPQIIGEIQSRQTWNEIRQIMGLDSRGVPGSNGAAPLSNISPAIVSTGLPDILLPVDTKDELNSISPDFDRLSKLSEEKQVVGVHAFTITGIDGDYDIHCRNFAPLYGIPEEAATGTANGALTYYLRTKGIIENGTKNSIIQGEAMERPSKIISICEEDSDGNSAIKVGGNAATLAEGHISL